ncbi:HET-domain-containing protein [Apiospora aurea]|uniref:HET-domain-containing protein n=1 Tax=Apiospora aurea TaxID=335848 RepID=A0ABR1PXR9_9PEZI
MEATAAESYPGGQLNQEDSFRVIEIQPGERNAPINVRLVTTNLQDCAPYEALSYAWGDLTQTESIEVVTTTLDNGDNPSAPLSVTISCADALRRLRCRKAPRSLWVDAICINQTRVPERNHQLLLMPRIYSGASRVVIYLGESNGADSSDAVMDWLREIHEPSDSSGHLPPPDLNVIREFLGRRWFTRVWVLQEVRLAREAIVVCGDREVSWDAFRELRDWVANRRVYEGRHRFWDLPYTVQSLVSDGPVSVLSWLPSYHAQLLHKLVHTRDLGATDPRDKLFAVIPLLEWEIWRYREAYPAAAPKESGRADCETTEFDYYGLSPAEIFTDLARELINGIGLRVLYCAATPAAIPGLPSWAPDWSYNNPQVYHVAFLRLYGLAGETGTQLRVEAASGGTIAKLGDVCDMHTDYLPLEQWEALCEPAHLECELDQRDLSRFIDVLFKGDTFNESAAIQAVAAVKRYNHDKSGDPSPKPSSHSLDWIFKGTAQETALMDIFQSALPSFQRQAERLFHACHRQRLFVTDAGCLGLAPEAARIGDQVMIIKGLDAPFVVRPEFASSDGPEAVLLLGTCYVERGTKTEAGRVDLYHTISYEERVIR